MKIVEKTSANKLKVALLSAFRVRQKCFMFLVGFQRYSVVSCNADGPRSVLLKVLVDFIGNRFDK